MARHITNVEHHSPQVNSCPQYLGKVLLSFFFFFSRNRTELFMCTVLLLSSTDKVKSMTPYHESRYFVFRSNLSSTPRAEYLLVQLGELEGDWREWILCFQSAISLANLDMYFYMHQHFRKTTTGCLLLLVAGLHSFTVHVFSLNSEDT